MPQLFYNFCFPDGEDGFLNHGYYYLSYSLSHSENLLYSHTEFNTPEGRYQNIFQVKFEPDLQNQVVAYKHNNGGWVNVGAGQYPTSAYPLLLPKVVSSFSYLAVSEDTGEILGEAVLEHVGDEITETIEGNIMRRFTLNPQKSDAIPISIDWGGAVSFLCKDELEAVKGTNITIPKDILLK